MEVSSNVIDVRHPRSAVNATLHLAPGRKRQVTTYVPSVREGDDIDREQWARLLEQWLRAADLTPERAAAPVGPIDANWRTIRKWLDQEQNVGARRVRDVARALGYPPTRALVEVGFLDPTEVGVTGLAAPPSAPTDPVIRKVNAALSNQAIPDGVRTVLRQLVDSAYQGWLRMQNQPPKEPSARERAQGATQPHSRRTRAK